MSEEDEIVVQDFDALIKRVNRAMRSGWHLYLGPDRESSLKVKIRKATMTPTDADGTRGDVGVRVVAGDLDLRYVNAGSGSLRSLIIQAIESSTESSASQISDFIMMRTGKAPFPQRLHNCLNLAKRTNLIHIVSKDERMHNVYRLTDKGIDLGKKIAATLQIATILKSNKDEDEDEEKLDEARPDVHHIHEVKAS